jgi:hypothetical protein
MKAIFFLVVTGFLIFNSCTDDSGLVKVTYFEAKAVYGDIQEVRNENFKALPQPVSNPGKIYMSEEYLFVGEENKGIHVYQNSATTEPFQLGFINIPGNKEFIVDGNYLYAESYYDVVKLNIADPLNVTLENRIQNVFSQEFTNDRGESLLGFTFNEVTKEIDETSDFYRELQSDNLVYLDFAEKIIPKSSVPSSFSGTSSQSNATINRLGRYKDYLYVLGRYDLHVIADSPGFELVNTLTQIGDEMETIFPYNDKLFVGSRSSMEIFDLSNLEIPVHQYRFEHATSCDPVLVEGSTAYVSLRTADFSPCPGNTNALLVIDLVNMAHPKKIDEIQMNSPYGMAMIDNKLIVGEGKNGLSIFDATNPNELVRLIHSADVLAFDIIKHPTRSDQLLIAGSEGLEQYIISNDNALSLVSRIEY